MEEMICNPQLSIAQKGFWIWKPDLGLVHCSSGCTEILGLGNRARDLSFGEVRDRIHRNDRPIFEDSLAAHLEKGSPFRVRLRICDEDGHYQSTFSEGAAFRDGSGAAFEMSGTITLEATDSGASEANTGEAAHGRFPEVPFNEEMRQAAMEFAKIGMFEWNLDSGKVRWDHNCCRINGLEENERVMDFEEVPNRIHPDDLEAWQEGIQRVIHNGEPHDSEHRLVGFDGITRWAHSKAELIEENGQRKLVGTVIDVSDHRAAMVELLRAQKEAEEANRSKSRFMAVMNHELRTPLNTIIGPCEMALEESTEKPVQQMLQLALNSGSHLLDLINRVLDLARIESGGFNLEWSTVQPRPFVEDFLKSLSSLARKNEVELQVDISDQEEPAIVDQAIVSQVLFNLVGNAIKYCGAGTVTVGMKVVDRKTILSVADEGPGIEESEKERIFDMFHRVTMANGPLPEGTGVGLSICKRLADLVGGSLDLETYMGKGSTFTFVLPFPEEENPIALKHEDSEEEPAATGADDATTPPPRVLIVEDNRENRFYLEALVKKLNLPSDSCLDGKQAVELYRPGIHRIVLMDIFLPVMSGEEAAVQIREKAGDHPVWIIAQTAGVALKSREELLSKGLDDFVAKPIGLEIITEAVKRGLRNTS
jgi:PAS domain S-box-containing protein